MPATSTEVAVVAIGRNEGHNLAVCLGSAPSEVPLIYVDSGSSDGSVSLARTLHAQVVELSEPPNFTAARARNAGLARLLAESPDLEFVQMIDGDCELRPGWIALGLSALRGDPGLAAVFGRTRERFPERSIFNALADHEWDLLPVGEASGVGGCALFRVSALRQVDCYNPSMIAGEDTELAMRLRKGGWRLLRADAEMVFHDINMTRLGQWWRRTRRTGHAYGEMAALHPDARDPNWPHIVRSIQLWGGLLPTALITATAVLLAVAPDWRWCLAALALLLPWLLNIVRLAQQQRRRGLDARLAWAFAFLTMAGKVPQFVGLLSFYRARLARRASRLMEYKSPGRA